MTTQITKKEEKTDVATSGMVFGTEGISQSDIMLPKLLIMQKMSKLLDHADVTAKEGDIVNSLTKVTLSSDKPLEIIPMFMKKFWMTATGVKPDMKFSRMPVTPENVNLAYDEVVDGQPVKRHQEVDWYVMLPKDIAECSALPCVVTFKKTSMPASRKLATFSVMAAQLKQPACAFSYELKTVKQSNEHGTFCVFEIGAKRPSSKAELEASTMWYKTLNSTSHTVDDELEDAQF